MASDFSQRIWTVATAIVAGSIDVMSRAFDDLCAGYTLHFE